MTATPGEWWRSLHAGARAALLAAAAVLGANVVLAGLESVTGGGRPGGPASSSYATAPEGLAAWADLLRASGHPVRRIRTALDRGGLDPATTLVLADAGGLTRDETEAVVRFVDGGGRLVVTGRAGVPVVERVVGDGLTWSSQPAERARPLLPVPEVAGVESVATGGAGSWSDAGATLPVLGAADGDGDGAALATVAARGGGRVVALADTSPLQNRLLATADNAAFALSAVGEPGRPVGFAEAPHGYGLGQGLSAVPAAWKRAAAAAAMATLVWMWSRGRRLGPPEELERLMPPPRRAYVDAVAATLAKTRRPAESMAPLQAAARRRLERAGGLPPGAGADELARVASRLGLSDDDVSAVVEPATSEDQVIAAARVLSQLQGSAR